MTLLLRLIREHPNAVEADLQHVYHVDLLDFWRKDATGRRLLSTRKIAALIEHLPPDSACARAMGGSGWMLSEYLLADIYGATVGEAHPARPKATEVADPVREAKVRQARKRARERQEKLDSGEIT